MSLLTQNANLNKYLRKIEEIDLIDQKTTSILTQRIREGDERALGKLVRSNLRFVVSVAVKYQGQGVPLADLIGEGNGGLIEAAKRFDETKGVRFTTYAYWWVRQAILKAISEQARTVQLPQNRVQMNLNVKEASEELLQQYGRQPSAREIAAHLDVEESRVKASYLDYNDCVSVDLQFREDGTTMLDILFSRGCNPDIELIDESIRRGIDYELLHLSAREAEVLRLYFGLKGDYPLTLGDIGNQLGVTRERIRQLKERALRKLRRDEAKARLMKVVFEKRAAFINVDSAWKEAARLQTLKSGAPSADALHDAHVKYFQAIRANENSPQLKQSRVKGRSIVESESVSEETKNRSDRGFSGEKKQTRGEIDVVEELLDDIFL